jgi:hypothetical protein
MYTSDPRSQTFNAVVYGGLGTGKTSLIRTARKPVLIHSFDPGGTKVLRDEIAAGSILADTRFENEDPRNPTAFKLFDDEYHRLRSGKFFDQLGTYVIDSVTTWGQCAMNAVLKKAGRAGGTPQQNDWMPQMMMMENAMRDFVSLPCDCILIGHDDVTKDEASGRMFVGLMITGKLSRRVPLLFDEIYCAQTKETSKGIEYQLLTRATGMYQARSRLGKGGELDTYEIPDIKHILKKVGMDASDKPNL